MSKLILEILGDFHPLVVHFPIGMFGLIGISLVLFKLKKIELPIPYFKLINYLCLLSLIVAIGLGVASDNSRSFSGKDGQFLEWHEQLGFAVLFIFCIACALLYFSEKNKIFFKWYVILYAFALFLLSIGGHLGNTIVHGEVKLISYFEEKPIKKDSIKLIAKKVPDKKEKIQLINFNTQIWPIFEERCFKCHGQEKQKGDLRLDTLEYKEVIEPFHPEKSKLVQLISLPDEDEDIMPAKGDHLTKETIQLISDWVKQGAITKPAEVPKK